MVTCPIALSGCTTAAVAAAGIAVGVSVAEAQATSFINGSLRAARFVTMEQGIAAARQAMHDLQLDIRTERLDPYDSYIRGRAEPGPEIKISLKYKSPVMTRVDIRVGIMGDQTVSRLVMSRIDAYLDTVEPVTPELAEVHEVEL